MITYTQSFPIQFAPQANEAAFVTRPTLRLTVLTSRLLRLELSPDGRFEDRPSQTFWYRRQPVPDYDVVEGENGRFTLHTTHLTLTCVPPDAITITVKATGASWQGQPNPTNLLGTFRTLDDVSGALKLEEGLLARDGWAVYDDTPRLVFNADGWLEPRHATPGYRDLYFFGHGHDYAAALYDFAQLAGPAPLLPRWALGNWWSRYWPYTADELLGLMDEFTAHNVPLSVCIIDMDWHITQTGNRSSGWTGYTWNRALFPDPPGFIAALHQRGLKTALNIHPADGVHPHEEQYPAMAQRLGIDPANGDPIPFNIADPEFTRAYFELLHHPQEANGIDFWWTDWQQGTLSTLPGLDPLWWLNHLHFYDLGRGGQKRPFVFSRWGGLGNHRYPIGFSGDTHVTWESLAFQPTFTATAANVNYGWWSHDIGGHMSGVEEPELYLRWVQFGVFSPIFRLHSSANAFHERRPWGHDAETARLAADAMRLRHTLIPYLYTMAWRNHTQHLPLVRPMYHDHPTIESAYHCPDQYSFGSELIVAPFTTPADPDTRLSRQVIWLPPGEWFDFFHSDAYTGDGWHAVYGGLGDIPVFARAGAIVPLAAGDGLSNPAHLHIHLFPGADNTFTLYEDDDREAYSLTRLRQTWSAEAWSVTIEPASGATAHLPAERAFTLLFHNVTAGLEPTSNRPLSHEYNTETRTLKVTAVPLTPTTSLTVTLLSSAGVSPAGTAGETPTLPRCRRMVRAFRMNTWVKQTLYNQLPHHITQPNTLENYALTLTHSQRRALLETILSAGCHHRPDRHQPGEVYILWNNAQSPNAAYRLLATDLNHRPLAQKGIVPQVAFLHQNEARLSFHSGNQTGGNRPPLDSWFYSLPERIGDQLAADVTAVIQFHVTGPQSLDVYLMLENGRANLSKGVYEGGETAVTLTATATDWQALIHGDTPPQELFLQGRMMINGRMDLLLFLADAISLSPPTALHPTNWRLQLTYLDDLAVSCKPSGE